MAGYVKLQRTIWQDDDFVKLSVSAQRLYLLLVSQADISHVGILPLMPARWSRFSADSSPDSVRVDLDALAVARFVVVDVDTEELWVRSYLVHDEAWKLTNGTKSLVRAHGQVLSPRLRKDIATVLATVGVTVDSRVDVTLELSQQPAAMHLTSSQQPAASSEPSVEPGESGNCAEAVAAAALELFIAHRIEQTAPNNPGGFAASLRRNHAHDHQRAHDYANDHPNATPADILAAVYGLAELDVWRITNRKGA